MSKTSEQIKQMNGQITKIGAIINEQTIVINQQSELIRQNEAALHVVIQWLGNELGHDAVDRLSEMMGVEPPERESVIVKP